MRNADGQSNAPEMLTGGPLGDFPRCHHLTKVLGHGNGIMDVRARKNDGELFTAVARDEVLTLGVLSQDRGD